jgi:hypothetical protein
MNPYSVPPVIPDMSSEILSLGKLGIEKQLAEKKMADEATYRTGMLQNAQDTTRIHQQQADTEMRKLPPSQQNFAPSDYLPMKSTLAQKGLDKPLAPIFERLDTWGQDKNVTKGVAANTLSTQWDTFFKPQAIEGLKKEYLAQSAKDPNFVGSGKDKELLSLIDAFTQMDGETAKKAFFPQVAQEEANTKAAIQQIKNERNKPVNVPAGGVLVDPTTGTPLYKNPRPPSEKLVQGEDADGNPIWIPQAQAAGQKVGKKGTPKALDPATAAVMKALGIDIGGADNDPLGLRKK